MRQGSICISQLPFPLCVITQTLSSLGGKCMTNGISRLMFYQLRFTHWFQQKSNVELLLVRISDHSSGNDCHYRDNTGSALIYLFFYLWLCWVFIAACGHSLVVRGDYSSLWYTGFSLSWLLSLQSTGSRVHGLSSYSFWDLEHRVISCGTLAQFLCGLWTLPDQGSNPCLLHGQADSEPLGHLGSPLIYFENAKNYEH